MHNVRIENHRLIGQRAIYRADQPPYDPADDDEPGTLVLGNGMEVIVRSVFRDWNGVQGLDMLYVHVPATGLSTHVTPADVGVSL